MNSTRRMFFQGVGGTLALPLMEARAADDTPTPTRLLIVGNPFGMHPEHFFPKQFGRDFEISRTLQSLDWVKDRLSILSHTDHGMKSGRGGMLGMGAFLTLTADSLGTSPIHRAVYVMENFLGIHPAPPPGDVEISEPDVRQAKTIKEILQAHTADATCASCHESIDPYGYAFENFDPMGSWREFYTAHLADPSTDDKPRTSRRQAGIPIDPSGVFRNGTKYSDIREFRSLMLTDANRDRFVRCFITKLLTYANGEEPKDFAEIEKIMQNSAQHNYRIVDTIAAVVHSPLFREQ